MHAARAGKEPDRLENQEDLRYPDMDRCIYKKNGLHPYRRANILATTICSFPFFLPYGGCVLLFLGGVSSMMDTYTFLPKLGAGDMMFTAFYSWAIWIIMLICCVTGIGRPLLCKGA